MLQAAGRNVKLRRAYSGRRGLEVMQSRRPDLVLLDIVMPELDGLQVLERMRQDEQLGEIPVVLLSGAGFAQDVARQRGTQMTICRPDGLGLAETLDCLRAVTQVLAPRYDERSAPESIVAEPVA